MDDVSIKNLKDSLSETKKELESIIKELAYYSSTKEVKKYLELIGRKDKVKLKLIKLEEDISYNQMCNCNHIYLYNALNGEDFNCVKCGLNNRKHSDLFVKTIKKSILLNTFPNDLEYVKMLYERIKSENIDCSDWTIAVMLENKLNNDVREKFKKNSR